MVLSSFKFYVYLSVNLVKCFIELSVFSYLLFLNNKFNIKVGIYHLYLLPNITFVIS